MTIWLRGCLLAMALGVCCLAHAQQEPVAAPTEAGDAPPIESDPAEEGEAPEPENAELTTISTLQSLLSLRDGLREDIRTLNESAMDAQSAAEKQRYLAQAQKLTDDLNATLRNIEEIAAGAHLDTMRAAEETKFDFTQELFSLLEPAINEMKDMTSHVRQKAEQREKISYIQTRMPITAEAIANLTALLENTEDETVGLALQDLLASWRKQETFLRAELQTAQVQLAKLEASEQTLAEASESYLKSFFQNRGRYLGQAVLVVIAVLLISRLVLRSFQRYLPGFQQPNRPLRIRLVDLALRVLTLLLAILGPMVVFYLAEDWLLFSLGLLLLLGIGLGLRQAVPRYWQQVQLFLNVGTVREGERVEHNGLPWRVKQINVYTMMENPDAGLIQRLKIDDLVDLRSRPLHRNEPWFPCRMGDWVLLNDGSRGRVVGLSQELVELVERGGARKTFTTSDFLGREPLNLSVNFRIKETIGVTYALQAEAVSTMPELLRTHVEQRLRDDGYGDELLNLRVEFERANTSSLDLVVIADFKGELAELYNRLRRALQRYCVEACSAHGWEIPFTQITLHEGSPRPANG